MRARNFIKKNAIIFAASVVLFLIVLNTGIVYYNNQVLKDTNRIQAETEDALYQTSQLWDQVVRNADIGMRGYALTKNEGLLTPQKDAIRDFSPTISKLRTLTTKQNFPNKIVIDSLEYCVNDFLKGCLLMSELVRIDSMRQFHQILKSDPGRGTWMIFARNSKVVKDFENNLSAEAIARYEKINDRTAFIQILLIIIGAPTLIFLIYRILKDQKSRLNLFLKLEKNNREFLFNPGTPIEIKNEDEVIENSIKNFKKATDFISEVSTGNYEVEWVDFQEKNKELNKSNLAGELVKMRDRMKTIKTEDEIRAWTSEGLAKFSDVIRQHQQNLETLSFEVLVYLTKYLGGQQGALFILKEENNELYLELTACYAFNKKKFLNKRIEIGQGMIGQAFKEGESVMLTEIPEGYTQITSGLGEKSPQCLLIIPMKYNEKIEAVIEIASFKVYQKYQIQFMEKVGEIVASTLGAVKNTEKVQQLLDQFQAQTELLKSQEEELRQNLEEMEATQEALRRQERSV